MSLNCRLNRNISLVQPGESGDGCEGQDISMGVGGLRSPILVYNISDVESLKFENDNRADDSLVVDTINSTGQFYKIDFTSASYNEEYDNHKWTHTLTLDIANITPLFEDLLSDGTNGRYLICFKPNGSEDYRMFGWKYGATLDYSLNITEDSLGYTVTLEDVSEYPLFTVYADNFGSTSKVYTPIFKPLWDVYICEEGEDLKHTGYAIAMYVVKVNAAGQPLGSDNKLCQWTGKKQDAYKFEEITSDGGYNIIGTYGKNATFDGRPVKVMDLDKCSADVDNSIYINQKKNELISLNSTISSSTFTITSTDNWTMTTTPQYVTIYPTTGNNGNTICEVNHNGVGGIDYIDFMNDVTHEVVTLEVIINLVKIGDEYRYPQETTDIILTPTIEGCNTAFTYTITPSVTHSVDSEGNIHITFPDTDNELEYTLTTTHGCDSNEIKVTKIYRAGIDDAPDWVIINEYCEFENGEYTGYRITVYRDYNSSSPTYASEKTERTADAECNESSPIWEETESYCEKDANGVNTGYFVVVQTDLNEKSKTYGQTRETKTMNASQCPGVDPTPFWVIDDELDPYCEKKIYEPSMVEGNTGRIIFQLVDTNIYSPTYNQRVESALTESQWTSELQSLFGDFPCEAPSTEPDVEEITRYCETEEVNNTMQYTGYAIITGMDKNPYSSTYLVTVTVKELDADCGGSTPSCTCDDLQIVGSCSCSDLTVIDGNCSCNDLEVINDASTLFERIIDEFNDVLSSPTVNLNEIESGSSTWNYLKVMYDAAEDEYDNDTNGLFDSDNFQEVVNYHGNNTEYSDLAFSAMTSWVMAMALSEIIANSGDTTNNQTEIYKRAYEIGGGTSVPLYGSYALKADPMITRLVASAIYNITRADYSFDDIDDLRDEFGTSPIDLDGEISDLGYSDNDNICDKENVEITVGYAVGLNNFLPKAAGPFATSYWCSGTSENPTYCTPNDLGTRTYPTEQGSTPFNATTQNYIIDETIDDTITSNYNLNSVTTALTRTVQACADDADETIHKFAEKTYYKYDSTFPRGSFSAGTPSDYDGYFSGVFNSDVTNVDLSVYLSNSTFTGFWDEMTYIGSHYRHALTLPQYGRRRPGQGQTDISTRGGCSGDSVRLNYLDDNSIRTLVGAGTKYDRNGNAIRYFVDKDGNAIYSNGDIEYGTAASGSYGACMPLNAHTYPSGHSSGTWGSSMMLMQMLPSRAKQIFKAANNFAVSRTIVRAHWNSDTLYGRLVATTLMPIANAINDYQLPSAGNFRTLFNTIKSYVTGGTSSRIYVNFTIVNNTSSDITLKNKLKVALYNDNQYGWNECYNNYLLIDESGTFTVTANGGTHSFNNVYFVESETWTTTRHFLDVSNCSLFQEEYPNHTNVSIYDTNGLSETYIPQSISPSLDITDGSTYSIIIN